MIGLYGICNRAFFEWHHGCSVALAANGIKEVFQSGATPQKNQGQQQYNTRGYERLLLSGSPN